MYLEVTPAGGKYWRVTYRYADKEKRLALGVYPNVTIGNKKPREPCAVGVYGETW
jgi:hypothetical protein